MTYTLQRLQSIEMPMQTLNLKLTNIQRVCKEHIWPYDSCTQDTHPGLPVNLSMDALTPTTTTNLPDLVNLTDSVLKTNIPSTHNNSFATSSSLL